MIPAPDGGSGFQPRIKSDKILKLNSVKPQKVSKYLRLGRASVKNQHYLLTSTVLGRKPFLAREDTAEIVLSSLHWLEKQGTFLLDAAVVMPDHLHFVAGLKNGSLATLMRSLKSFTAQFFILKFLFFRVASKAKA